jgi:hypothetical protein
VTHAVSYATLKIARLYFSSTIVFSQTSVFDEISTSSTMKLAFLVFQALVVLATTVKAEVGEYASSK